MPNLLGDFIRNIVIARRPEKRHLQAIEHAVRRIPLDVQLGFFNAIALYQIADIDHELRLQQIELADRDLKGARTSGAVTDDRELEVVRMVIEGFGRPRFVARKRLLIKAELARRSDADAPDNHREQDPCARRPQITKNLAEHEMVSPAEDGSDFAKRPAVLAFGATSAAY